MHGETDRRVQKTRKLLKDALISLILEKGFDAVTIQELLDRANVGRSTFYIHFQNKHELLHSCFEEFKTLFDRQNFGISSGRNNPGDLNIDFIRNTLRTIEKNSNLCKALLGKESADMLYQPIYAYILNYIEDTMKKLSLSKKQTQLKSELSAHYITSALIGSLTWWVSKDIPCSVEEMDKNLKQLIVRDINTYLLS